MALAKKVNRIQYLVSIEKQIGLWVYSIQHGEMRNEKCKHIELPNILRTTK
jgi:hypothetical protein